ncbi:MAG TPA: NAD-dependent epimerase/dehydratase family protein, partial [Christiangramia sp.]|nr:NAD-dependent epimerase/dehydratase family protein [Christiangramia sp.]
MTTIDKTKPVLVTGATGYVAGWLVKRLLEEGMTVHAAVRDPQKEEKVHHLNGIAKNSNGTIKYFKSDLLNKGSYAEAMQGCELVFHTASPFTSEYDDPQKELIEPAVKGTANVLNQANKTDSVKRIVLTSSCAAIYTDAKEVKNTPNGKLTEEMWNTTASLDYQTYSYSKTLAEKKAWEINKSQQKWDLVTINPSLVMGPPLNPNATTSESFSLLKQLG